MRTVVFPNPEVARILNERFVCAWINKRPEEKFLDVDYDQRSLVYWKQFPPGTGVSNITAIFATPGGIVLNAIPGYLDAGQFREEMQLALALRQKLLGDDGELKHYSVELYRLVHQNMAATRRGSYSAPAHLRLAKEAIPRLGEVTYDYFGDFAGRRFD